ncbi:hypothetical protein EVAR_33621_1 [Eumeta japonica]|uniref:Uncharacterized protein n=1 Tax=Eumeta variegata TaxID=151549 RepID=A0A4C1WCL9_EUMVA|nr:hypothetical protein EVAR_33621_1 [Eumeta japonica]
MIRAQLRLLGLFKLAVMDIEKIVTDMASATSATADGLAPEGASQTKKFAYKLLKRGLAKSFAYKLLKRGLANLMSPTSTSGVALPLINVQHATHR